MNDFNLLKKIVEENNSFLLSTHVNPDADALGSVLSLAYILKNLSKDVRIVNHSSTPYNLKFLDEAGIIEKYDARLHDDIFNKSDVCMLLDLNQANRIVSMEKAFRDFKGIKVCIDHHQNNENIFDYSFGGAEYNATCEILYDFITETKIAKLDYSIAYQLYAGIMTDTGSFRFERTSPRLHKIAAELLETGVNPTDIYDKIYNQFKFGRVKLLGEALSNIKLDSTGKIAYMTVTLDSLERNNSSEADVDGFVNYCLTIQDVQIGIFFYELKDGIKVSFRSKGKIPVNKLAGEFNGGGHINASGSRLDNIPLDDVIDKIITAAKRYIK
jgi:phosphoesterase RecJ-like protein